MGLITPGRLARQSQQPLQIDWANPITRGLVLAQSGMLDGGLTNNGGVSRVPRANGITRKYVPGSAQYLAGAVNLNTPMTFFVVVTPRVSGADMAFMGASSTGADRHLLYVTGSNLVAFFSASSAGTAQAVGIGISAGNTYAVAGRTSNVGSRDVWVNGVKAGTDTTTLPVNTCTQAAIGAYLVSGAPNASFYFDGEQAISLAFNRALSDAELQSLSANPWQVFRNPVRRLVFDVGIGGTNSYSYTAAGGVVFSGVATKVRGAARTASGGIATGGTASASRGAARSASGGLTLAGAAGLAKGRKINAAGGLTLGGAATILRGVARSASGGLLFAGHANVSFTSSVQSLVVTPVGGIVFAGASLAMRSARKVASGGIAFAGRAATTFFPPVIVIAVKGILPIFVRRRRRK